MRRAEAMWLEILYRLGLTDLSDETINAYRTLRGSPRKAVERIAGIVFFALISILVAAFYYVVNTLLGATTSPPADVKPQITGFVEEPLDLESLIQIAAILLLYIGLGLFMAGAARPRNSASAFSLVLIVGSVSVVGVVVMRALGLIDPALGDFHTVLLGLKIAVAMIVASSVVLERLRLPALFALTVAALVVQAITNTIWPGEFLTPDLVFLLSAGAAVGLALAVLVGARKGRYGPNNSINPMPGASMHFSSVGALLMFLGLALTNSNPLNIVVAFQSGVFASALLTSLLYRKIDLETVLVGGLGSAAGVGLFADGLVANIWLGAIIGIGVAFVIPLLDKLRIDDTCLLFAPFCVAPLVLHAINLDFSFLLNLGAVLLVSAIVSSLLKVVIGLRVDEESEEIGLDRVEIGLEPQDPLAYQKGSPESL